MKSVEVKTSLTLIFFAISANHQPFRIGVHFDAFEQCTGAAAITCEPDLEPHGTVGFKLIYWQMGSC